MTRKTRNFVIASLLVLATGIGTGLVAYYVGFPLSAIATTPDELELIPADATLVVYADVRTVMNSDVRRKILEMLPARGNGQQELQNQTGINVETDIDSVVACIAPAGADTPLPAGGMVLARGRFNDVKIEALMREHGARVEDYKGKRLIVADHATRNGGSNSFSVAFLAPGLVAVGSTDRIRGAVDLQSGGKNITSNDEVMTLVRALEGNAWAVGRFDVLTSSARLPATIAGQLPPITWFSASTRIDGGMSGVLRADARDEESATSLRDVVRGVVALARLQAGSHPELRGIVDSVQLGGIGKTVTLSFDISPQMFDLLVSAAKAVHNNSTGIR